jgi:uncharacterized protein (TIGR02594 family)
MINIRAVQQALKNKGYDPGPIDGIRGELTNQAIVEFKRDNGLWARPKIGPITLGLLGLNNAAEHKDVPWLIEANKVMELHEKRDNRRLRDWLRSDSATLGDPSKLPWCGDFVETAIKNSLPLEPFEGRLGKNRYLARNWLEFGVPLDDPCFGAVVVFWRGRKSGHSGHVGFIVGIDKSRNRILTRGGNQSNAANDAWLGGDRVLGYRWPSTYSGPRLNVPQYSAKGVKLSTNEF